MATIDTVFYVPTFFGLTTTFGISCCLTACCLFGFEVCRRLDSMQCLFNPRSRLLVNSASLLSKRPFSWLTQSYYLDEDYYVQKVGLDATMHLRYLRMTVHFLLLQCLVVCPILASIHWTANSTLGGSTKEGLIYFNNTGKITNEDTSDQFHSNSTLYHFSIANIPDKHPIVWVHVILLYFISLSWLWLLFVNHWHHLYLLQTNPSTNHPSSLHKSIQLHDSNKKKQGMIISSIYTPLSSSSSSIHHRSILITNIPPSLRNTSALRHHFNINQVGTVTSVNLLHRAASHALEGALKQRQKWLDKLERRLILLARQLIPLLKQQRNQEKKKENDDLPIEINWFDISKLLSINNIPCDDIKAYMHDILLLDNEIERLRDSNISPEYYKPTSTAFVTFESAHSAQICAQAVTCWKPGVFDTRLAPEPRDILWTALLRLGRKDKMMGRIRKWIVFCSVWSLTIFWLFPISFILGLTSIESLSQHFGFLNYFLNTSTIVRSFIQNILPTLLVTLFMSILPWILLEISKQQDFISYSELEDCVLGRYYHFAIFNVLIVFLLGTSFLSSILDILYEPAKIIQLLANSLPQGANFFLNYILFNSATHGMEMIQLGSQLFGHLFGTMPIISKTPRILARWTSPWSFPFYYYYPNHILILVITITYSVIQPLILIFALFYFGLALAVYRHQYAFCYIRRYESGGSRHFRRVTRYTSDGLLIFQLTMVGLLYLKGVLAAATAILPLIIFTVWMKIKLSRLFGTRAKYPFVDQLTSSSITTSAAAATVASISISATDNNLFKKTTTVGLPIDLSSQETIASYHHHPSSSPLKPPTSVLSSFFIFRYIYKMGNWVDEIWKFSYLRAWWKHGRYATQKEQHHWTMSTLQQQQNDQQQSQQQQPSPLRHLFNNQYENNIQSDITLNEPSQEQKKDYSITVTPTTGQSDEEEEEEDDMDDNHEEIIEVPITQKDEMDIHQIPGWSQYYNDDGCSSFNDYGHPSILTPLDKNLYLPKDPTLKRWKLTQCVLIDINDLKHTFELYHESSA
ncbi:unnamed protein product [Cunninghamella echinulata]